MKRRGADPRPGADAGKVRLIGGRWRGSRLDVPLVEGLRPSPDRVRETLFNWLQGEVSGARCLDLFAGSGALGFEAASRGAGEVVMIERDPRALAALAGSRSRLQAEQVEIVAADALTWLAREPDRQFDLVFVDPPFAAGLLTRALAALEGWLAPRAWIYLELARADELALPPGFSLYREGRTREVRYLLVRCRTPLPEDVAPVTLGPPSGGDMPQAT